MEENKKNWLAYALFVIASGLVGTLMLYFVGRSILSFDMLPTCVLSILAFVIYLLLCILLRNILYNVLLSEVFSYLFFGVLTTVINFLVYYLMRNALLDVGMSEDTKIITVNTVAFIAAVVFAYITNKIFVFRSFSILPLKVLRELAQFFGARIATYLIETFGILLLVKFAKLSDIISKIILSVICIILNYIFSKLVIFKKENG